MWAPLAVSLLCAGLVASSSAFLSPAPLSGGIILSGSKAKIARDAVTSRTPFTSLTMAAKDEVDERELANMARAARKVGPNDRVVEIRKPMGLVLEEDERGNVYIVDIIDGGNASKNKKINVGDMVSFVSATFGDEIWSTKGVGLSRVQSAIKLRQGNLVKIVLESTKESIANQKQKEAFLRKQKQTKESEQEKRDRLLAELQEDTKAQKKKGWYGLF